MFSFKVSNFELIPKICIVKHLLFIFPIFFSSFSFSQIGQVWPIDERQDFDMNEKYEITKTYDATFVCQFFMFINNNEFIHCTDDITSLYKIISRDESKPDEPMYTVISESGNQYIYIFNKKTNEVTAYSSKGFAIVFYSIDPYETTVFQNINR